MFLAGLLKRKGVLYLMLGLAVFCGLAPQNGMAMPVDSQVAMQNAASKGVYAEKIQNFLNKEIVKARFSKLGLNEKEINNYISKLDDSKLQYLAKKIDSVNSAGDGGIILVLILLLIFVSVLYFTDYGVKIEPRRQKK